MSLHSGRYRVEHRIRKIGKLCGKMKPDTEVIRVRSVEFQDVKRGGTQARGAYLRWIARAISRRNNPPAFCKASITFVRVAGSVASAGVNPATVTRNRPVLGAGSTFTTAKLCKRSSAIPERIPCRASKTCPQSCEALRFALGGLFHGLSWNALGSVPFSGPSAAVDVSQPRGACFRLFKGYTPVGGKLVGVPRGLSKGGWKGHAR